MPPTSSWKNQEVVVASNDGRVLFIELPASVVLEVTYTSRASRAIVPTLVPSPPPSRPITRSRSLFINQGDRVKVDTRTGAYLSRVTD